MAGGVSQINLFATIGLDVPCRLGLLPILPAPVFSAPGFRAFPPETALQNQLPLFFDSVRSMIIPQNKMMPRMMPRTLEPPWPFFTGPVPHGGLR